MFVDDQIAIPMDLTRQLLDILNFDHFGTTKMETEAKIFWWPEKKNDIETKVKDCTACLASGKSSKYQLLKKHYGSLEKLTERGQEIQIDFTGKLQNENILGDVQILIAVDRFSKPPTVKICNISETKEVTQIFSSKFILYGILENIRSDEGNAFITNVIREFCKNRIWKLKIVQLEYIRETER